MDAMGFGGFHLNLKSSFLLKSDGIVNPPQTIVKHLCEASLDVRWHEEQDVDALGA